METKPKVSVVVKHMDNPIDADLSNFVRIYDYDRNIFLFFHTRFDFGEEPRLESSKEAKTKADLDDIYKWNERFFVDEGNWHIRETTTFNLTQEVVSSQMKFVARFGEFLGVDEARQLFKSFFRDRVVTGIKSTIEGGYQIKTAHAAVGSW